MLCLPQVDVNLFDLYLTNHKETIIIKFLNRQGDSLLVSINNVEVELPVRNFNIDRFLSRFNLRKLILAETSTASTSSASVTTASAAEVGVGVVGARAPSCLMVSVYKYMIIKANRQAIDKLMNKAGGNKVVNLQHYPECWSRSSLVFTNDDNSIVVYYTGTVMETSPSQYGFVRNCENITVTDHGFEDSGDYWTIDWYIDAYKLHQVEDNAECRRLRQLAKTLPAVPGMSAEDRAKIIKSSPSWHKRYYGKFDADDEEEVDDYRRKRARDERGVRVQSGSVHTHTRKNSNGMEVSYTLVAE